MSDSPSIDHERAAQLLNEMLCGPRDLVDRLSGTEYDAFSSMQDRFESGVAATSKQLLWIQGVAVRLNLIEEASQNLWSGRTLQERERIRGKDVPTPAVLLDRPLKPPGRT